MERREFITLLRGSALACSSGTHRTRLSPPGSACELAGAVRGRPTQKLARARGVGEKTGVNSALGIAPKTEDFIKEATTSDMLEIEAAKIAQQKGDADEKTFAGQMIADHTKTSSELKGLVPPDMTSAIPTSLDDSSQKSSPSCAMPRPTILPATTTPCRSALTRTQFRCSNAMHRAATIPAEDWTAKRYPHCSTISRWPN
jgi:putative membrane protein